MKIRLKNSPKVEIANTKLKKRIYEVIEDSGLPTDFNIKFKGYSKRYWGRYYPESQTIIIYVLTPTGKYLPLDRIIKTAIHEAIHHYQHTSASFVRCEGVMHDEEFIQLETRINTQRGLKQL